MATIDEKEQIKASIVDAQKELASQVAAGTIDQVKSDQLLNEIKTAVTTGAKDILTPEAQAVVAKVEQNTNSDLITGKKKISTIGWVAIIGGSVLVVGGIIFAIVKLRK